MRYKITIKPVIFDEQPKLAVNRRWWSRTKYEDQNTVGGGNCILEFAEKKYKISSNPMPGQNSNANKPIRCNARALRSTEESTILIRYSVVE